MRLWARRPQLKRDSLGSYHLRFLSSTFVIGSTNERRVLCSSVTRWGRGGSVRGVRPTRGCANERRGYVPRHAVRLRFGILRVRTDEQLPNMRLKLAGARGGRIALPRWLAFLSAAPPPCARGQCARSLSAIR